MKIAWFTPLSKKSGISKYSLSVVKTLHGKVDVDIWTKHMSDNFLFGNNFPIYDIILNNETLERLNSYDAVVYNMGNDIIFHYEIYEFYKKVKGVLILHDKIMHNFFAGYFLEKLNKKDEYIDTMEYYYGQTGKKIAIESINQPHPVWETEDVKNYPLLEPLLWNTYGVLVHSKETLQLILDRNTAVPTNCMFHPFYLYNYEYGTRPLISKSDLGLPEDKVILLFSGVLNRSKRIHKVLEVLAKNVYLRNKSYFIIAGDGTPEYVHYLKKTVSRYHLNDIVKFTGFIDDYILHSYIKNADICINLRFPSTESGSGSIIEQLFFQKPVIVTKIGFFDELPDDSVVKVSLENELKNLEYALERLINDTTYRNYTAESGHKFAFENFLLESYVNNLISFVEDKVLYHKVYIDFIDNITDETSNFLSLSSDNFINNLANEITTFLMLDASDLDKANPDTFKEKVPLSSNIEIYKKNFLKEKILALGWRFKYLIKRIPLLNALAKRVYYSLFSP
jgi:glycosyltransferase involved in cell wall biosynthesis